MFLDVDLKPVSKLALVDDKSSVTYGELTQFINDTASYFLPRTVILFLCENTIGAVAAYMSCQTHKAVPILLSASTDNELVSNFIRQYEPQYIWLPNKMVADFPNETVIFSAMDYTLLQRSNIIYPIFDELSLLMSTSGSTGSPKLVRYKYGNLEANAKNVALAFNWTSDERALADLGMHYTMGLNVINTHIYVGSTVFLTMLNIMSNQYWQMIKENQITNLTGVPFSYDVMARIGVFKMDLPHLTTLSQGGGKLSESRFMQFAEYAENTNKRFIATFGTTETSARMMLLDPSLSLQKCGSIGKPIPYGEAFLLDENGKQVTEHNKTGELCYTGPNVTMGYATTKDDLIKGDEWNGTYHTGDLAIYDHDGFYYITGRKSRFLKLQGYRIGLDEVELLIKNKFNIDCACIGDDKQMQIFITEQSLLDCVLLFISNKTSLYKSLFNVNYIHAIPRSNTGKVIYQKLISF